MHLPQTTVTPFQTVIVVFFNVVGPFKVEKQASLKVKSIKKSTKVLSELLVQPFFTSLSSLKTKIPSLPQICYFQKLCDYDRKLLFKVNHNEFFYPFMSGFFNFKMPKLYCSWHQIFTSFSLQFSTAIMFMMHEKNVVFYVMFTGYDKLKAYGFPIHGAIDGYSRKILWLKVTRSNNLPSIPARYYVDYVKDSGGCPVLLRTDCGTENGIMAAAQCYFRQEGMDPYAGDKAHRYGPSPKNQRIENWWSYFRRGSSTWWTDFFNQMCGSGLLDLEDELQMECLWFCFSGVLQEHLDTVKFHWNTHRIRPSRYGTVPGIPNVLYHLPDHVGGLECKRTLPEPRLITEVEAMINTEDGEINIYYEYFKYVMRMSNLKFVCEI